MANSTPIRNRFNRLHAASCAVAALTALLTHTSNANPEDLCPALGPIESIALVRIGEPDRVLNAGDPNTRSLKVRDYTCWCDWVRGEDLETRAVLWKEFGIHAFDDRGRAIVPWDGESKLVILDQHTNHIISVETGPDCSTIAFRFTEKFAAAMKAFSTHHVKGSIAIVINDQIVQCVTLQTPISSAIAITGAPTKEKLQELADAISDRIHQPAPK